MRNHVWVTDCARSLCVAPAETTLHRAGAITPRRGRQTSDAMGGLAGALRRTSLPPENEIPGRQSAPLNAAGRCLFPDAPTLAKPHQTALSHVEGLTQ